MCLCTVSMNLCVHTSVRLCIYEYLSVSVNLCICVQPHLCCYVSVYLWIFASSCLCNCISVSLCTCVSMCLYICATVSPCVCISVYLCTCVSLCLCICLLLVNVFRETTMKTSLFAYLRRSGSKLTKINDVLAENSLFLPYKIYNTIEEGFHTYYYSVILYALFRSYTYKQILIFTVKWCLFKVKQVVDTFYSF